MGHQARLRHHLERPGLLAAEGIALEHAQVEPELLRRGRFVTSRRDLAADKQRGGDCQHLDVDALALATAVTPDQLIAIDDALAQLERDNQIAAQIVKLRYFTGLTVEEAGQVASSRGFQEALDHLPPYARVAVEAGSARLDMVPRSSRQLTNSWLGAIQDLGNLRVRVAEYFAHRRPAFRVAGNALRASGDEGHQLSAECFDDLFALVGNAYSEEKLAAVL